MMQSQLIITKHFVFSDFDFCRKKSQNIDTKNKVQRKWYWINAINGGKRKKRRRKQRMEMSLCVIDENGEIEENEGENKTVLNVRDLNDFINDHIKINDNISEVASLCNDVALNGTLNVNNREIELQEMPLLSLKLREIFFRKLVLLSQDFENKYILRRQYWLRLNFKARLYLIPFGSFEDFRDLYHLNDSVKANEILSVIDKESFDILEKAEWLRAVMFKSYIEKIRRLDYVQRTEIETERKREINEIIFCGNFNDIQRFRNEQLSLNTYSCHGSESTHFHSEFDAMEREIEKQIHSELMERS